MLGAWYHIVTTVSGTTMRSYINGVLQGDKADGWEPNAVARNNCYIGKPNWPAEGHLNGAVASLKIYSGAMTQAEVTAAYAAYTTAPTAAPTAAPSTATLAPGTAAPTQAPSTATLAPSTSSLSSSPTQAPSSSAATSRIGTLVLCLSSLVLATLAAK